LIEPRITHLRRRHVHAEASGWPSQALSASQRRTCNPVRAREDARDPRLIKVQGKSARVGLPAFSL